MLLKGFNFDDGAKLAMARANKMVSNGLYSRFGLSYNKRVEKAFLGCLGEVAFEYYLNVNGIKFKLDTTDFTANNSDEFDFFCNGKKIDVKVAKKTTKNNPSDYWTYGYPQDQNPKSKDIVVIGWIDFSNKIIGFYGWISGYKISQYPVVEKNSFAGYKYLTPNHEFKWGVLNKNLSQIFQ
jgi:hypothetical protein